MGKKKKKKKIAKAMDALARVQVRVLAATAARKHTGYRIIHLPAP
jgi:hypothetical protein